MTPRTKRGVVLGCAIGWGLAVGAFAVQQYATSNALRFEVALLRADLARAGRAGPPTAGAFILASAGDCMAGTFEMAHPDEFDRLRRLTTTTIAQMEAVLKVAGVDPSVTDDLPEPAGNVGGPFIPSTSEPQPAPLADLDIGRWERLQRIVRTLPLHQPLKDYRITSPFGTRVDPIEHRSAVHQGIDLEAPRGTPVLSAASGHVVRAGRMAGYGRVVEVDHGHGIHTLYGHLSAIRVHAGQRIPAGARVGLVGNTGRTTGPHLHYEVRVDGIPRDPMPFLTMGPLLLAGWRP